MSERRLLWLYDQMTEQEMTGQQIAVMVVLLARDAAELGSITKAEIGSLVGVQERQVSTVLKQLEEKLSLVQKQRNGGSGKGRAPNNYIVRPDATGNPVPETWRRHQVAGSGNEQSSAGNPVPAKTSNQQSNTGSDGRSVAPAACGEVLPPIEHAAARGRANLKTTTTELYPERLELVCVGSPVMPDGGGELDMSWVLSASQRAFANERGFLNGSCDELFGQFLDHCATKGPKLSASWRSEWGKWVRNEVKFNTERAQRISQSGAPNERTRNHSYASAGRGRARSIETEILMRDIAGDPSEPIR